MGGKRGGERGRVCSLLKKARKEREGREGGYFTTIPPMQSTRTDRVDSWRSFQQKGSKKKKTKGFSGGLKPPKLKQEKRT